MKTYKTYSLFLLLMGMSIGSWAQESQNENPRGVYKLINFVGRGGSMFDAIEDQYKICLDSLTLTLHVKNDMFEFSMRDGDKVFDYTGEEPDVYEPHAPRIYDSNAKRFSLKWWSEGYIDRPLFPTKDWCIEHYEAERFSQAGECIAEAFMSPDYRDESNPLIGVWHPMGTVKNLQDAEGLKRVLSTSGSGIPTYCILTPLRLLNSVGGVGKITPISIQNKDSLQMGASMRKVTWLSPDIIAIALQQGHTVWARTKGGTPLIAQFLVPRSENPEDPFATYMGRNKVAMELVEMGGNSLVENVAKVCRMKKVYNLAMSVSLSKDLARSYVNNKYASDLIQVYKSHTTLPVETVQKLNGMYNTPQARAANGHLKQAKQGAVKEMRNILNGVSMTGTIPVEPVEEECAETYKDAFLQYYQATHIEDVMLRKMEVLVDQMAEKDKKVIGKQMPALSAYMKKNLPVMLQNSFHSVMTEEDLRTLASIAMSSEGVEASKANMEFANAMSFLFHGKKNEWVDDMRERIFNFVIKHTIVIRR